MTGAPLLQIDNLTVEYLTSGGVVRAVNNVSLRLGRSETLALVGESGSGKSTIALAIVDLLRDQAARITGRVAFDGHEITNLSARERRALSGQHIGIVFQDPFTSLNPSLTIGRQVGEPLMQHMHLSAADAWQHAIGALAEVGLPDPRSLARAYPHQLSGGMQQRVLIATAIVCNPELLILDEPTTALDVTVEAQILDLLDQLRRQRQLGMIYITHNLGVVNRIADRVCVVYAGQVVEVGPRAAVLGAPMHPYTKGLLASLPHLSAAGRGSRLSAIPGEFPDLAQPLSGCAFAPRCPFAEGRCRTELQETTEASDGRRLRCWKAVVLQAEPWPTTPTLKTEPHARKRQPRAGELRADGLAKIFRVTARFAWTRASGGLPILRRVRDQVHAVDGVSLALGAGDILGLVGESGSGKTTLGRLIVRLLEPTRGTILLDGENVKTLSRAGLQRFRKMVQLVFQNPDSSLNPRCRIGDAIARVVELHGEGLDVKVRRARVDTLLTMVGLPLRYYDRYPHQLSGGEKQRAGIARALATEPAFIVCDEPVSALDVSVQAVIINLLKDLRDELGVAYLFISHDLSVVANVADRIAVMYAGRICEEGAAEAVLRPPYHPYTEALLSAVPLLETAGRPRARVALSHDSMTMPRPTTGCVFANRCHRKLGSICHDQAPPLRVAGERHHILCHIPLEDLEKVAAVVPRALAAAPNVDSHA